MKDSHHPHPDHQHTIEIIVNSRTRHVHERELSYSEVLELAFPGASNTDTIIYTIAFEGAAGKPPHEGTLAEGGSVHVKKGTCFHVVRTDKS